MKSLRSIFVVLVILGSAAVLLASAAQAGDTELVIQALEATYDSSNQGWAYTETTVENGEKTVRRFDPRRLEGEQWSLISVDGRPPTERELREDAERRSSPQESPSFFSNGDDEPESESEGGGFSARIRSDSLSLIEETSTYAVYRSEPGSDDDESPMDLELTLKVIKDGPYVASIEMRSRESFKPIIGVEIKEMVMTSIYEPVAVGGPVLPRSVTMNMVGRVLFFKEIRMTTVTSYSDYEYVGE